MKDLELNTDNTVTMSSLEIAKLTGKRHGKVRADIERILLEADIGIAGFRKVEINLESKSNNNKHTVYHLPRRESDLVVSGYSVKYRLAIIDRWHELEATKVLTESEIIIQQLELSIKIIKSNIEQAKKTKLLEIGLMDQKAKTEVIEETLKFIATKASDPIPFGRTTVSNLRILHPKAPSHKAIKTIIAYYGLTSLSHFHYTPEGVETVVKSYTTNDLINHILQFVAESVQSSGKFCTHPNGTTFKYIK